MTRIPEPAARLSALQRQIVGCERCPRLIEYCRQVARVKRRMYRDEAYWAKPVPGFGDPRAELLILGLAPGAHGSNRTGRMFTGDRSGDFLYGALHEAGFANQPVSRRRNDGLRLRNCYITAAVRCAPPGNKPRRMELANCQPYLEEELRLLRRVRAVLCLGRIAFDTYLRVAYSSAAASPQAQKSSLSAYLPSRSSLRFAHGASYDLPFGLPRVFVSYHPSQQNTQTGRLTPEMMRSVIANVRRFLESAP